MDTYSAPQVPDGTGEHPPPAATASGAEGARRVLAVLQAFSPQRHTLTARELAGVTGIPLPSMYRYIALLRETGLLAGDDRGAYRLTPRHHRACPRGRGRGDVHRDRRPGHARPGRRVR